MDSVLSRHQVPCQTLLSCCLSLLSLKVVALVTLHNTLSATSCSTVLSDFSWRCHNTTPLKISWNEGTGNETYGQLHPGTPLYNYGSEAKPAVSRRERARAPKRTRNEKINVFGYVHVYAHVHVYVFSQMASSLVGLAVIP
jgi:hypothetical protein